MFACFKKNLVNKEIKVAQLAGSVAELSAYHHGEVSDIFFLIYWKTVQVPENRDLSNRFDGPDMDEVLCNSSICQFL